MITLPNETHVVVISPAARLVFLKEKEEFLAVKAISNSTEDGTLPHTIVHGEVGGELIVPSYISKLFRINKNKEANKDWTKTS